MKVVAYSVSVSEKELLAIANQKKHDITLISNALSMDTVYYATGKEAVLVFTGDDVSAEVIGQLAGLGVKFIATRSVEAGHIDREAAAGHNIKLANVPLKVSTSLSDTLKKIIDRTITNLDQWEHNRCTGKACICAQNCRVVPALLKRT